MCQCGTCMRCKDRARLRRWRIENPTYGPKKRPTGGRNGGRPPEMARCPLTMSDKELLAHYRERFQGEHNEL